MHENWVEKLPPETTHSPLWFIMWWIIFISFQPVSKHSIAASHIHSFSSSNLPFHQNCVFRCCLFFFHWNLFCENFFITKHFAVVFVAFSFLSMVFDVKIWWKKKMNKMSQNFFLFVCCPSPSRACSFDATMGLVIETNLLVLMLCYNHHQIYWPNYFFLPICIIPSNAFHGFIHKYRNEILLMRLKT